MNRGSIAGEVTVCEILAQVTDLVCYEENLVQTSSPVYICGDIHGQYEDLLELFRTAHYDVLHPDDTRFIFLGDCVDRGKYSVNTFLLLCILRIRHPASITLLRGNHESRSVTLTYGFRAEIEAHYANIGIYTRVMELFDLLPLAAITDNDVFSVHGGLSPSVVFLDEILAVNRRVEIPERGIIADLTWSDPEDGTFLWRTNPRGAGYVFGSTPAHMFCHINRLRTVTRSHQLVMEGFRWYFADGCIPPGPLIDVWSAPNYSYTSGNIASILRLRFDAGNPWDCPTFRDVAQPDRIAEKEIKTWDYFL
jgi:diadenosine tetraphosphatase ApaH/serine/threonine PP2A family protein phosphatase